MEPGNADALVNLARLDLADGSSASAERKLNEILSSDAGNLTAALGAAAMADRRQDSASSEKLLAQARAENPDSVEAQLKVAQFYLAKRDFKKARRSSTKRRSSSRRMRQCSTREGSSNFRPATSPQPSRVSRPRLRWRPGSRSLAQPGACSSGHERTQTRAGAASGNPEVDADGQRAPDARGDGQPPGWEAAGRSPIRGRSATRRAGASRWNEAGRRRSHVAEALQGSPGPLFQSRPERPRSKRAAGEVPGRRAGGRRQTGNRTRGLGREAPGGPACAGCPGRLAPTKGLQCRGNSALRAGAGSRHQRTSYS